MQHTIVDVLIIVSRLADTLAELRGRRLQGARSRWTLEARRLVVGLRVWIVKARLARHLDASSTPMTQLAISLHLAGHSHVALTARHGLQLGTDGQQRGDGGVVLACELGLKARCVIFVLHHKVDDQNNTAWLHLDNDILRGDATHR